MFVGLASDISCTTNLTKMFSLYKLYELSVFEEITHVSVLGHLNFSDFFEPTKLKSTRANQLYLKPAQVNCYKFSFLSG